MKENPSKAELILEYAKTLIWPVFAIILVIAFNEPIYRILDSGEFEVSVLGNAFKGTPSQLAEELENKKLELKEQGIHMQARIDSLQTFTAYVRDQRDSLDSVLTAIRIAEVQDQGAEAIQQIQQEQTERALRLTQKSDQLLTAIYEEVNESKKLVDENTFEQATKHEQQGIDALINEDYTLAFEAFSQAEKTYPGFHNAFEISRAIRKASKSLRSADEQVQRQTRINLLSKIISDYSWGMDKQNVDLLKSELELLK